MTSTPPRRSGWKRSLLACALLAVLAGMGTWGTVALQSAREGSIEADARLQAATRTGSPSSVKSPGASGLRSARQPGVDAQAREAAGTLELSGRVTDEQGQPIENVRVLLRPKALTSLDSPEETTTDVEGRYRLAPLPPGLYDVSFFARRYLANRVSDHALTASGTLDVVLEPALLVEGRVVDEQGQPISGAQVKLAMPPGAGEWDTSEEYEEFGTLSRERSGEDGRFVLDAPDVGPWHVSAFHRGYLGALEEGVKAPASGVKLVLARGAVLEVEVEDEQGRPVAGAECQLSPDGAWIAEGWKQWTDEHGRAVYEAVREGRYALAANTSEREPYRVVAQKLELRGQERRRVRLRLPAGWGLQGVVVDSEGKPVAGATVRAVPDLVLQPMDTWSREEWPVLNHNRRLLDEWSGKAGSAVRTGADGRFVLKHLLPRAYRVNVSMLGYKLDAEATGSAVEVDGQSTGLRVPEGGGPVRLVLAWRGVISGRVVRQGGGPLKSFTIDAREVESEDGRFTVALEEKGPRVRLAFGAPGLATTWRQVKATPGQQVDLGDVVLSEGRPVLFRVVDAETGGPVHAAVLLSEQDGVSSSAGVWGNSTGRDGVLLLEAVERRPLTVVVRSAQHLEARASLAPEQEELTVALHPGATVQGWMRNAQGPVALARVYLYDEAGVSRYSLDVREGWHSRQGVAEGHYVARVHSPDEVAASFPWQEVRVPGTGVVQLDFVAETQGSLLEVRHSRDVDEIRLVPGRHPPPASLAELRVRALRSRPYIQEYGEPSFVRFPVLPAGPHTLMAWRIHRDRLEVHQQHVDVSAGSSRVVELHPRWQPLLEVVTRWDGAWGIP
ncbi:MAG: carboxypeptidase regulatory-like domain-containing protein [Myxococcaceae bacterium]|nr:carboxypeptidase regulatory-like domain-containing protein [Myxococcaceae bacterium]